MSRSAQTLGLALGLMTLFAVFVAAACGGGSDTPEEPPPVCYASHPVPDGGFIENLDTDEWADLVVRGYHEGQASAQDCVGDPIEWRPTDDACDVHEPSDEPPPNAVPLTEESVIVGRSDSAMVKPVWVITHEFEDGDGFGPVVLTERDGEGVAVRAIGSLRMPTDRARLRLRETGGQRFVIADGERCPEQDEPTEPPPEDVADGETTDEAEPTCLRYARILPVVGDDLASPEVRTEEGQCLGPAQVYLAREEKVALQNGWERTFRLAASMEYRGGAVIVHEQVTVEDSDPRDPGRPPRMFRTSDGDRVLYLRRGGIRSRGIPLFERSVRANGSTQLPIAEARGDGEQSGSSR